MKTVRVLVTMRLERLIFVAAVPLLLAGPGMAADHPDMSGTWAIDAGKSDFGPMPVMTDLVVKVTVDGQDFHVNQTGGGQPEANLHFSTSGKEVTNEIPGGKMTSTHHWEGSDLLSDVKIVTDDGITIAFKDRISYSADGMVMTMKRSISGPMGEGQMTIVMNKK